MSGSTAIAVLIRGRGVYVANVGDSRWGAPSGQLDWQASLMCGGAETWTDPPTVRCRCACRAVLAEKRGNRIHAVDLSIDQTPYR